MEILFLTITYLGSPLILSVVTLLSCLSFLIHNQQAKMLKLLFAMICTAASIYLLKIFFDRPRPEWALYKEDFSSFPSGHAALSIALYGFLFYSILKHEKHPLKNKTLVLLGLIIVLVGSSRIYLGVHYISDVIAGYAIGVVWLLAALRLNFK